MNSNELTLSQPVSVWNKSISLEPKKFLQGIGKAAIKGASLDWSGVGEAALDTIDALGLQKQPNELAWLLISRSLAAALAELVKNNRNLFRNRPEEAELETLSARFAEEMGKAEVTITPKFLEQPGELPLLEQLRSPLTAWLQGLGAKPADAEQIACHLRHDFVFAIDETQRKAPQDYAELINYFDRPFFKATEEVRSWQLYAQWLQRQVSDRMFEEAFGVEKVYVPLRAYYEEKERDEESSPELAPQRDKVQRIVVDLESEFRSWLDNFAAGSAVRFISGGPGSGKSTFAKIFAAKIAAETNIPTLYIPLHRFNATGDLITAMENYIRTRGLLPSNPLDAKEGKKRLLIIFDGLDELALQGKAASEIANDFVSEVLDRIREFSNYDKQWQVIITGRTIAVQSVETKLRKHGQIIHVLPYFIAEEERKKYHDPDGLLIENQRQRWWQQYGKAAGKGYAGLPDDLARQHLVEITAQPLLNYLVALSYDRKTITFSDETTLNQIYADLIRAVYCRQYEGGGRVSACAGGLDEKDFIRILEEIALAVWHGDGRTATVAGIQAKCETGGIKKYLEQFQEGAKAGVTRLLTAFYFRQSDHRQDGDPTFEFTHKSFGEYLTALRIVRLLRQMQKQRKRRQEDPDDGWSEKVALQHWTATCAVTWMDDDLLLFISNEFQAMTQEELLALQAMVRGLLSYTINQGLPFPEDFKDKGFKEHLRLAGNAEGALLAVHFHIAELTKQISRLELEDDWVFGEWIRRVNGIGSYKGWLGYLDLSGYDLSRQNFYLANFVMSRLEGARLSNSILIGANLNGAYLERIEIVGTNFQFTNLERAHLKDVNFSRTDLLGAKLEGANLEGAILDGAILTGTILEKKEA
ncbi:MAG: pentapeptide repeat-containing protein [Candidatus Electronema sp. V4]|uniref:pentapeptide repeat-containing protein n=1 Tax=Candidatus Electronema sp. V4 TaxID=3454756 RepID=UPI0040559A5B